MKKIIKFHVWLKRPKMFGLWTSYLDIYIFGKKWKTIFMRGHPELMDYAKSSRIEIPEKDIEKECGYYNFREDAIQFKEGARWYKEELRNRINNPDKY